MGPCLDRQIGLGTEANPENNNGEEASDVARQLPILPLSRLSRRRRSPAEGKPFGLILVSGAGPSARPVSSAAAGPEGRV